MVRSILPSKWRGAAHDKAMRKRAVRRTVRADVSRDGVDDLPLDLFRDAYVSGVVQRRRDADKLNHFMRWCEAMTEGMSYEDKLSTVKALLPKNLIGEHAYGHWELHCKYPRRFPRNWYHLKTARREQGRYDSLRFRLRRALAEDPTLTGRLNAAIKARKLPDEPRRMLLGVHDVDAFAEALLTGAHFGTEYRTTINLIEAIEGGREAALDVCGRHSNAMPSPRGLLYPDPVSIFRIQGFRVRIQFPRSGSRIPRSGSRVPRSGSNFQGPDLRFQDPDPISKIRIQSFKIRIQFPRSGSNFPRSGPRKFMLGPSFLQIPR